MKTLTSLLIVLAIAVSYSSLAAENSLKLITSGNLNCVVILPSDPTELQLTAAEDFRAALKQATGDKLEILREGESSGSKIPLIIGPSKLTRKLGYSGNDLEPEQFRIVVRENAVVILAKDIPNKAKPESQSMVTSWAFSYLLDRYMGVVRLWPGELGTVVPEIEELELPMMDVKEQPRLFYRSLRNTYDPDLVLWTAYYQIAGSREKRAVMHSFREGKSNGDWWGRFHQDKPEMLARGPDGKPGHAPGRPHFCKICVSNPDVVDEVIRLWKDAGSPDYWDLTPNDGTMFCTCEGCRELDRKYGGVEYTKEEIWKRPQYVSLTERYVWFWNQVINRMKETKPNAKIGVYFYSAYRNPPKNQTLAPGIFGAMVPTLDTSNWDGWIKAGASEIGLRPNWWYMGACGPSLHLRKMGHYIEHARENEMVLFNKDSLYGFWATQGIKYYVASRLVQRWDLDTEDVISEYCDAFGSASSEIRRYFDYWEQYDEKVAYNIPAGGKSSVDPNGIYETYCRETYGDVLHPLTGHWKTLSAIYNPKIMAEAGTILKSAHQKADDELTRKRIEFLAAGLDHVEICGALVDAPKGKKAPHVQRLVDFNKRMTDKFGYWGVRDLFMLNNWRLLDKELDVEGM